MLSKIKPAATRNVAVIAHVDHGKTTLCDSLLARAQVLNQAKAGKSLALDTGEEEKARGITITSTGIRLVFDGIEPRSGLPASNKLGPLVVESDTLYLGNLPVPGRSKDFEDEAALDHALRQLICAGQPMDKAQLQALELRPKRGFALARFASPEAAGQALRRLQDVPDFGGRVLVVEPQAAGPEQQLFGFLEEHQLAPATFELQEDANAPGQFKCTARIPDVLSTTTESYHPSRKAARRAVASAALSALQSNEEAPSKLVVNLIDCPGHVDFSGEVTASLRLADGALVVVDAIEGVGVQTETVLRQALAEGVRPVLVLNKVDRCITELQYDPETSYLRFEATIAHVNDLIAQYQPEGADFAVSPADGSVAFASGLHGWGFTLPQMAARLLAKQRPDYTPSRGEVIKVARRLWGSYYVDPVSGKWKRDCPQDPSTGQPWSRTFCHVVLQPIYRVFELQANDDREGLRRLSDKFGCVLKEHQWCDDSLKDIRKLIMKQWLPVAEGMLEMINWRLPSPFEAQPIRLPFVYDGDLESSTAQAIAACRADGPLVVYVSKMLPAPGKSKEIIGYGRVFSGTVRSGDRVHVLRPEHTAEAPAVQAEATVRVVARVGATTMQGLGDACAGDIVGLVGLEGAMTKAGTVTDSPAQVDNIKTMRFSVSPVVRVAIRAIKAANNNKIVAAMRRVEQQDPCLECLVDKETGEKLVAGVGELHVEVAIKAIAAAAGCEIQADEPVVQCVETILSPSEACLAKSSNKHNRLFVVAEPLPSELIEALDSQRVTMTQPLLTRVQLVTELTGWDRNMARKIMSMSGTNVLVDCTVGMDLSGIADLVILGFKQICAQGPVTNEALAGVCFKIVDAKMHADAVHRRIDQILPMARAAFAGAVLSAQPSMQEPIFRVDIQVPARALSAVPKVLKNRRGAIFEDMVEPRSGLHTVAAHLPVRESFGFAGDLMGATSGTAFPMTSFSHWQLVDGSVDDDTSMCGRLVQATRVRKGLPVRVPVPADFLDRL